MRYPKNLDWRGDPKLRGISSERHVTYFITEVMPYVESRYPIRAENSHRILAGLSMGAGQSFQLAIRYPHLFGYVAPLSNGAAVNPDDGYSMAGILPGQTEAINKHIREWYISIGTKDFLLERAQTTHAIFNELGIKHAYFEREGKAHTWDFWVDSVIDFLPQFSRLISRE